MHKVKMLTSVLVRSCIEEAGVGRGEGAIL